MAGANIPDEPKGLFRHKILVVDDQVGIVSFLYEFFTIKGYEVLQAIDGKQALEIVKKEFPPVVLLDIRMGWGMDGIEVLKEIKKISPKTGVIMMTSVCEQEVIQEAFDNGAADYLVKPFSLDYLEQIVVSKILNLEIRQIGEA